MNKSTLVIGASQNPERYSNQAVKMLKEYQHDVYAFGNKEGKIGDVDIQSTRIYPDNLHSVTLYVNPSIQKDLYDYVISLHPERLIFNPGTENNELVRLANAHGIETVEACTLVMLRTNQY